jgi:hypothetical protein
MHHIIPTSLSVPISIRSNYKSKKRYGMKTTKKEKE